MMQVKIWSDVRCPFCYIGKKKFEAALENFPQKDKVEVVWKSFQLDPTLKTDANQTTLDYFVKTKGVSKEQARQMLAGATQMANAEGWLKNKVKCKLTVVTMKNYERTCSYRLPVNPSPKF